jgi:hypothetical protein
MSEGRRRLTLAAASAITLMAAAAAAASCGGAEPTPPAPPPADSGIDAPLVAPKDASMDVAVESSVDAGDVSYELKGELVPVPGLPVECDVRVAKDPAASVARFPWRACPSGRSGCESFRVDWSPYLDMGVFRLAPIRSAFEDASGVHLTYERWSVERREAAAVVRLLHGDAEFVVAGNYQKCYPAKVHASEDGVAAVIGRDNGRDASPVYDTWATWGTALPNPSLETHYLTDLLGGRILIQGIWRGDGFLAFEQTGGSSIFASGFRFSDKTLFTSTPQNNLESGTPVPVPGGYFAVVVGSSPYTGAFMPIEGGYRTVIRPMPGADVQYIWVDRKNANALVWVEKSGNGDVLLYTAPFTTTEAGLQRRAVARLPRNVAGEVNAGVFTQYISETTVRVVRLSDGKAWDIAGESDPLIAPIWVNDDFVWVVISGVPKGAPGYPINGGLVKLPRPTSAPTIPSGL